MIDEQDISNNFRVSSKGLEQLTKRGWVKCFQNGNPAFSILVLITIAFLTITIKIFF